MTPLCTLSSFASAPTDFSQPTTGSNDLSIPTSLPSFSILQYVDQPHELLFLELFEVDSIDSGPAYFQPTGIFEVTCPKRRKRSTKRSTSMSNLYPRRYLKSFGLSERLLGRPASRYTYSFNSSAWISIRLDTILKKTTIL